MLTVGSLFAGIGGFDLGLERAGMRSVWQCEIDPYCIRVLEKHWPDVLRVRDVRDVGVGTVPQVDVICGGFPCQDLSVAGRGAGLDGERSGLWFEYARVVRELRPRYVIVENVPALLARGLGRVLGELAEIGYDAEWDCIPASAIGAPHIRDRIWLVAYPCGDNGGSGWPGGSAPGRARQPEPVRALQVADADDAGRDERRRTGAIRAEQPAAECARQDCPYCAPDEECGVCARRWLGSMADPGGVGCERRPRVEGDRREAPEWSGSFGAARDDGGAPWGDYWAVEPDVGRVADGVPARVDRLRALGNALVPQIAEWIGRRIVDYEEGRVAA